MNGWSLWVGIGGGTCYHAWCACNICVIAAADSRIIHPSVCAMLAMRRRAAPRARDMVLDYTIC